MRTRLSLAASLAVLLAAEGWSQGREASAPFSFGKPDLKITAQTVPAGGVVEAGDSLVIEVMLENTGNGPARAVELATPNIQQLTWLRVSLPPHVGEIKAGQRITLRGGIAASLKAPSQSVRLVVEAHGSGGDVMTSTTITLTSHEVQPLQLRLTLVDSSAAIAPGMSKTLTARLANTGTAVARQVELTVLEPASTSGSVKFASPQRTFPIGDVGPNQGLTIGFNLEVADTVTVPAARVVFAIKALHHAGLPDLVLLIPVDRSLGGIDARVASMYEQGRYEQLIGVCVSARQRGEFLSSLTLFRLGMAYAMRGETRAAIEAMENAAGAGSRDAERWLDRNTIRHTVTTVRYEPARQGIEGSGVTKIGMLGFLDSQGNISELTDRFTAALGRKSQRFAVVPHGTLERQKAGLGIQSLDASNPKVLASLESALGIKYVVHGLILSGQRFRMTVTQTRPQRLVHTQEYQQSATSSALEDALLFFTRNQVTVYSTEHRREMRR